MKTLTFLLALACAHAGAQTVYVSLQTTGLTTSYCVSTNDAVTLTVTAGSGVTVTGFTPIGSTRLTVSAGPYCGFTNIVLTNSTAFSAATLQIIRASTATVSNYVPADAIVIPASATGNVSIILESSPDLVNWTAASPGTYSAANGANRFFRVRAAVQ